VVSQARREAVAVEIAYAVLPSALFVLCAALIGGLLAWALGLRGEAWGLVGMLGLTAVTVAALARTLAVLLRARRDGL